MKYFILVPDGAADVVNEGESTPLEEARMPAINGLAKRSRVGLVRTIPRGIAPGSDAANLGVLGYDPKTSLTGRSPLEAVSMGIELGPKDVAFRTNLVTLTDKDDRTDPDTADGTDIKYSSLTILDHASGDISDDEARVLVEYIDEKLCSGDPSNGGRIKLYPGVSYRNALIVRDGPKTDSGIGDVFKDHPDYALVPPHDILGRQIGLYLPDKESDRFILRLMEDSYPLLKEHEINKKRISSGLRPANSIWIWGEGTRPALSPITKKYGVDGVVISAVDLIKGIGICAGLEPVKVEGATGTITTNFKGKGQAAIDAFAAGKALVYMHVEAPDECAHQGNREEKILSLEYIDEAIVAPVLSWLRKNKAETGEEFRILIVPDHRTPVVIRTHTDEPVPFVFYDSSADPGEEAGGHAFSERSGAAGEHIRSGMALADVFFKS